MITRSKYRIIKTDFLRPNVCLDPSIIRRGRIIIKVRITVGMTLLLTFFFVKKKKRFRIVAPPGTTAQKRSSYSYYWFSYKCEVFCFGKIDDCFFFLGVHYVPLTWLFFSREISPQIEPSIIWTGDHSILKIRQQYNKKYEVIFQFPFFFRPPISFLFSSAL